MPKEDRSQYILHKMIKGKKQLPAPEKHTHALESDSLSSDSSSAIY